MTSDELIAMQRKTMENYSLTDQSLKIEEKVPFEFKFTLEGSGFSINLELHNIIDYCKTNHLNLETKVLKQSFFFGSEVRVIISGKDTKENAYRFYHHFTKWA